MKFVPRLLPPLLGLWLLSNSPAAPAPREIPPAPGPHVNLTRADFAAAQSFRSADRIVGAYYFYWYDASSKAGIVDGHGPVRAPAVDWLRG
jgi:hypothetical protein